MQERQQQLGLAPYPTDALLGRGGQRLQRHTGTVGQLHALQVALVAMNLAGMTAIAQAHSNDDPAGKRHRVLGQLAVPAAADHAVASQEHNPIDAVERFQRGERVSQDQPTIADDSRWPPTEAQVGESWRHPGNVRARSVEPSGRPGWLVPGLGMLAAALVLAGCLAVTTTRRARRRVQVGQAA